MTMTFRVLLSSTCNFISHALHFDLRLHPNIVLVFSSVYNLNIYPHQDNYQKGLLLGEFLILKLQFNVTTEIDISCPTELYFKFLHSCHYRLRLHLFVVLGFL